MKKSVAIYLCVFGMGCLSSVLVMSFIGSTDGDGVKEAKKTKVDVETVAKKSPAKKSSYMSCKRIRSFWSMRINKKYFFNIKPNAKFLFVEVFVTNTGNKAGNIPKFILVDEDGAEYEMFSCTARIENPLSFLDQLNPSTSKQGMLVFDVPVGKVYRLKTEGCDNTVLLNPK